MATARAPAGWRMFHSSNLPAVIRELKSFARSEMIPLRAVRKPYGWDLYTMPQHYDRMLLVTLATMKDLGYIARNRGKQLGNARKNALPMPKRTPRNLRIVYHDTGPDERARRRFTLLWTDPWGVWRPELAPDGKPVGFRRGQAFHAVPSDILIGRKARVIKEANPAYAIIEMDRETGEPTGRKEFYAAHNQYEAAKYALATRLLKGPGWKIGPTGLVVYRPRDNKVWVVDVGRKRLANPRKNVLPHRRRFVEKTAANFFRLLQKNADDVEAGRVTWAQFHRRQRELWTAIADRPEVNEEVSRMLRESLRAGRPGPNPRRRPVAWRRIFRDAREAADWIDRQPSGHVVKAVWFSNSTWQVVIGDYGELPSPKGQWVEMSLAELRRFAGRANPRKAGGPKPRGPMHPSRWPSWMRDEKAFRAKFGVSTQKFRDMLAFLSASRRAEFQRDVDRGFPELAIRSVVKFLKGNRGRR